jgi:hypothetical protein
MVVLMRSTTQNAIDRLEKLLLYRLPHSGNLLGSIELSREEAGAPLKELHELRQRINFLSQSLQNAVRD